MNGYLYYYKRTVYPVDADYYNISQGIAGYKQPQNKGLLLIAGTHDTKAIGTNESVTTRLERGCTCLQT